jgi:serine/threonine protein kinase
MSSRPTGILLDARELVQQIHTPNPQERPTLHSIVDHAFFTRGLVPGHTGYRTGRSPQFQSHLASRLAWL